MVRKADGNGGGRGGSVPSVTPSSDVRPLGDGTSLPSAPKCVGTCESDFSSVPEPEGQDADSPVPLADGLRDLGLFVLSGQARDDAAATCAANGVTLRHVEDLIAFVAEVEDRPKARRIVAGMLTDGAKLRRAVADLHAFRAAERKRGVLPDAGGDRAFGDKPAKVGPLDGEDAQVWPHDRMCRIAWCRVHSDRRSVAEVAAELGVSETTLKTMLDRGRVLSQSMIPQNPKKPVDDSKATG